MAFQNAVNANNNDFQNTSGVFEFANRVRYKPGEIENLGIAYNAGTGVFTIQAADGNSLSTSNPGYVVLHSKATPGKLIKYKITTNYTFIDDVGASQIIGNLFGWTTGVAIGDDVPFFIYFVSNDAESAVTPMISRHPSASFTPAAGSIGKPSSAIADTNLSFWALDNSITVGDYDSNPCERVGLFRMHMSTLDDWTVQALSYSPGNIDGIGVIIENRLWNMPQGQMGAVASRYMRANGGTVPQWTTQHYLYSFSTGNILRVEFLFYDDGGTDGAGAVNMQVITPFRLMTSNPSADGIIGTWQGGGAGVTGRMGNIEPAYNDNIFYLWDYAHTLLQYSMFSAGTRFINGSFIGRIGE